MLMAVVLLTTGSVLEKDLCAAQKLPDGYVYGTSSMYLGAAQKAVVDGVTYQYRDDVENENDIQITAITVPSNMKKLVIPEKINGRTVATLHMRKEDGAAALAGITELILTAHIYYYREHIVICPPPNPDVEGNFLVPSLEDYFPSLEKIGFSGENPSMKVKDGILFNEDCTQLLHYPQSKRDVEYTEPSSLTSSNGYRKSKYLKKVTFSSNSSYTYTPDCSYSNLETVCIPANIKNIWIEGFAHCSKLTQVQWHNGVEYILEGAFSHCTSLKKIQLPKSLIGIEEGAFRGCSNLNLGTLVLPKKLQWMQAYVFYGTKCKKVTIPDSVESMGAHAFSKQTKVVKPAYLKSAKSKYIPNDYFKNSYFSYEATALLKRKKKGKKKGYPAIDIERIWGTKKKLRLKKGKKITLQTKAELMLYANKSVSGYLDSEILKFRSSNPKVVKVTKTGKLQTKKKGSAVIQVSLRLNNGVFHVKGYKVKVKVRG